MKQKVSCVFEHRWVILAILSVQYLFVYFHRVCPAVVAQDLVEAFSISATSLGILASGYFYPYAIMQVPVGFLADSWGPRKTITFFTLPAAAGAFMFGLAPNLEVATISRIVVGFGLAGIFVPAMKALAEWFQPKEYARVSGILMAVGGIGWLSAATPLALVSKSFGWRTGFIAIGCITVVLSLLTWFFVSDKPKEKKCEAGNNISPGRPASRQCVGLLAGVRRVGSTPDFWPLAVWCFCDGAILFSFTGLWAGPYLRDVYGFSKPAIGNILSMVAVGVIVGSPFLGYLSDKVLKSRKKILFGCALVTVIEWVILYGCLESLPVPVLYGFFLIIGVCVGASIVICFTATKEIFPVEMAGTSVSCVNLFGFLGGVIYQPLIGHFLDLAGMANGQYVTRGYKLAFLLLLGTSLVHVACTFFVKEKPHGETSEATACTRRERVLPPGRCSARSEGFKSQ